MFIVDRGKLDAAVNALLDLLTDCRGCAPSRPQLMVRPVDEDMARVMVLNAAGALFGSPFGPAVEEGTYQLAMVGAGFVQFPPAPATLTDGEG